MIVMWRSRTPPSLNYEVSYREKKNNLKKTLRHEVRGAQATSCCQHSPKVLRGGRGACSSAERRQWTEQEHEIMCR